MPENRLKGDQEKVKMAARFAARDDDLPAGRQVTLKWMAERLSIGTWTNVANCLAKAKQNVKSRD